jgi:hypothetical protein
MADLPRYVVNMIWACSISVETRNGGRVAAVYAAYRDPKAVVSTLAPGAHLPDLLKQITGGARECRCTATGERHLLNHLFQLKWNAPE